MLFGVESWISPNVNTQPADNVTSELSVVVDDLLNQLTTKFSSISTDMIAKSELHRFVEQSAMQVSCVNGCSVDEMSRRLDSLEATIQASAAQSDQDQAKTS